MATTELIINAMNVFEDKILPAEPEPARDITPDQPTAQEVVQEAAEVVEPAIMQEEQVVDDDVPELVDAAADSDDEDDDEESIDDKPELGIATRTRRQTGVEISPPARYTMVVKVNKRKEFPW